MPDLRLAAYVAAERERILGIALAGDRFHAPSGRMLLDQFEKGLLCAGELWHELAAALSTQ